MVYVTYDNKLFLKFILPFVLAALALMYLIALQLKLIGN